MYGIMVSLDFVGICLVLVNRELSDGSVNWP